MQLDTWLIQRNIANAIRFSSIREHLRLTPMLFWFAMPVWQAFCVIQMSVAKPTALSDYAKRLIFSGSKQVHRILRF